MKKSSSKRPKAWERKLLTLAVASCFAAKVAIAAGPILPNGPTVINGQVFFNYNGNLLQITNTPGSVINWQGFSIGASEITRFIQQSASSAVLNRVAAGNPSVILGALQSQLANGATGGRVYLINPSGVVFGAGAQINTGGLVVSTLGLSDADFKAGRDRFTDVPGAGGIVNQGTITTPTGGNIYLVAPNIANSGIIRSDGGQIILAAGKSVDLVSSDSPDVRVTITAPDNEVVNLGQIIAQGGKVGIYGGLIRQAGVVNANTAVRGENGKIVFKATKDVTLEAGSRTTASGPTAGSISIQSDTGKAAVAGTVEANATQGKGGTITVVAQQGVTVEPTGIVAADGVDGGSVSLNSSAGSVAVAGTVTANGTTGSAGAVALNAATNASLASTARLSASGGQGNGSVAIKGGSSVALDAGSKVIANGAAGGTVAVQADQATVVAQGTIDATGTAGNGGNVQITALSDITLDDSSQILVGGRSGGVVKVQSSEGTLLASGLIDGQGNDGPGGQVWLLAPRVGLIRESVVNASGLTGGGTVLVGGDYQGKNPDIQNAWRTYFGPNAIVRADAIQTGNGGKVIVWSDDITRFYGNISARGGSLSGNGGFVEISGHRLLDFLGAVDLSASHGVGGNLLLDPLDITISATAASNTSGFNPPGDQTELFGDDAGLVSNFDVTPVTGSFANVAAGTTITLQATNNITVQNDFDLATATGQANVSLVMQANNDIAINANLSATGTGTIALTADADSSGVGAITRGAAGNTISQAAGTLTLSAGSGITATTSAPAITFANSTSGNVSISNSLAAGVTLSGSNSAVGGGITLSEAVGNLTVGAGGITTAASTVSGTASGPISITATTGGVIISGNVTTGTATVADTAAADNPTSGSVTVTSGGNITGSGSVSTGSSTLTGVDAAGADVATSGTVTLSAAAGTIGLSNANAVQIGTATRTTAGVDTATAGNIVLSSSGEIDNGTLSTPLALLIGAASNAATNNQGNVQATTTGGAGKIFLTSSAPLMLGAITTNASDVSIGTTGVGVGGLLTIGSAIGTANGSVILVADTISFTGTVNAGNGAVSLTSNDPTRAITIGTGATGLGLSSIALNTITTTGTLTIGSATHTGTIATDGAVTTVTNPSGPWVLNTSGGVITLGNNLTSPGNLTLCTNGASCATSGGANINIQDATVIAGGTMSVTGNTLNVSSSGVAAANLASTGLQTINVTGISATTTASSGSNLFAEITSAGGQNITVGAGGIALTSGSGGTTNSAGILQSGAANNQTITVSGGGNVTLTADGGATGATDDAFIKNTGLAQSLTFTGANSQFNLTGGNGNGNANQALFINAGAGATAQTTTFSNTGGSISLTGGTIGNDNVASIKASNGTQTITGSVVANNPSITLLGGASGGAANLGNDAAIIEVNGTVANAQTINAGTISLTGGPVGQTGTDNSAAIVGFSSTGPFQNITATSITLTGAPGTGAGNTGARIGGLGGAAPSATNVLITTTGAVTLIGGSNAASGAAIGSKPGAGNSDVTINAGGDVTLTANASGARIGSKNGSVQGGSISVTSTGGSIHVNDGNIRTTGNVTLAASAAGKVVDQTTGVIVANILSATADSGITLTGTNNAVSSFAATNNSANAISLSNTIALDIAAGNVTNTGRNVTLNNSAAVTETGIISAGGLELLGAGPYTLTQSNTVSKIAANTTGTINYKNSGALSVDTVNTAGITSGGNDVTLNANNTVTVTNNIATGAGKVNITTTGATSNIDGGGGTISSSNSGTGISLNAGGGIGIGSAVNTNLAGGGKLTLTTNGANAAGNMTLVEAGLLDTGPSFGAAPSTLGAGSHALTFTSTAGPWTVSATNPIVESGNDVTLITSAGNIVLNDNVTLGIGAFRLVSAGTVNQAAGSITAGGLGVRSVGAATINGGASSNHVTTLAANVSGANNQFVYIDNAGFSIGTVGASTGFASTGGITTNNGNVSVTAGNSLSLSGAIPISAGTGTVSLTATTGNIDFAGATLTAGGANITATAGSVLSSGGAATDIDTSANNGTITVIAATDIGAIGNPLEVKPGSGSMNFTATAGDMYVDQAAGNLLFSKLAFVSQGGVGKTQLFSTTNGSITIDSYAGFQANTTNDNVIANANGGASDLTITVASPALTGNVTRTAGRNIALNVANSVNTSGNISLTAGGTISDNAGVGTINGTLLTTSSVGGTILNGANTVTSFNATNSGSGNVSLVNTAAPLTITGISQAGGGNVAVSNTGGITLNGTGTVTGGNLTLTATGGVINQTGGTLSANLLTTSSVGGTTLNNANTVTSFNGTNITSGDIQLTNAAAPLTVTGISEAGGGNAVVNNTGAINFSGAATVTGGNLSVTATGAVTQGAVALTGNTLTVKTLNNAGAAITLNSATNHFTTVDIQARDALDGVNAAGAITYKDATALDVATVATTSTVTLTSVAGVITDSGAITGTTLTTSSVGGTVLDFGDAVTGFNATNTTSGNVQLVNTAGTLTVTGISQTGGGNINVNNTGNLTTSGLISTAANGAIDVTATTGVLTIGAAVTVGGTGVATLTTTGAGNNIAFSGAGTLTAGSASLTATGAVTSGTAATDIDTSANNGTITVIAGTSIGTNLNPLEVKPGTGTMNFTATTGGIFVDQSAGNLLLSKLATVSAAGAGQTIQFSTTNGTIQADSTAGFNANTANDNLVLTANGAASDMLLNGGALGFASFNLTAGRNITLSTGGLNTAGNATLTATGTISETGGGLINAVLLTTSSAGGTTLNNANTVTSFNGTNITSGNIALTNTAAPLFVTGISQAGGGNVQISNTGALASNTAAITTGGGNLTLNTSGTITLTQNVTAGTGTVTLNPGAGGVSQTGGALTAANLELTGAGTFSLNQNTNHLTGNLAANISGALTYQDGGTMSVGAAGATNNITTNNSNVDLKTGGLLTLAQDINAGAGTVYVTSSSGMNESTGKIFAANLGVNVTGAGNVIANNSNHLTGAVSINTANGTITYQDTGAVTASSIGALGNYAGTTGFDSSAGNNNMDVKTGSLLTIANDINAGAGTVYLTTVSGVNETAGKILAANLGVNVTGAGNVVANNANHLTGAVSMKTANGAITYQDTGAVTVGSVGASGNYAGTTGIDSSGGNGTVDVLSVSSGITLNNDINAGAGTVYLTSAGAGAGITEAGIAKVTAGTLGMNVTGTGNVVANSGNVVNVLGAKTANGNVQFKNTQALGVTTVGASGNFAGTVNGIDTSTTTGNTVDVLLTAGALTLNNDITTNTTGNVYLTAVTGISEAGAAKITTGTLGMKAGAAIVVNNANNDVVTLGATTTAGGIQYQDANSLQLGSVGPSGNFAGTGAGVAISTAGGTIDIKNGAATLTLNNDITAGAGAGDVLLVSGANINQIGGKIVANNLGMRAVSGVNVNSATNDAVTLAVNNSAAGTIVYNDVNAVTVGQVAASGNFPLTTGVSSAGAVADSISLAAGGQLTTSRPVNAGLSTVSLTGGGVTNTSTVTGGGGINVNATTANAGMIDNSSGTLTNGGGAIATAINLTADKMKLAGGAITAGAGAVNINTATLANAIDLGRATDATVSTLELSGTELNTITTTGTLTIGSPAHIGVMTVVAGFPVSINASTAGLVLLQNGGNIVVNDVITAPTINMDTPFQITGTGTVTGTSYTIIQSGGIGTLATPLQTSVSNLTAANSGSGDVNINNAGSVTLVGQYSNSVPGGEVRLSTTNGSINTGTAAVTSNNGRIALIANDTGGGANITVGAGGTFCSNFNGVICTGAAGGPINLYAADNVTTNGAVQSGGGLITVIAGTASGINVADPTFTGTNPPAPTEIVQDDNGLITFNAPVNAAAGGVILVSATTAGTSIIPGIAQGVNGAITTSNLTAVTLHGLGGQGGGGASIVLNTAVPQNTSGAISLFACPEKGCPDSGAIPSKPFNTTPFIVNTGSINPVLPLTDPNNRNYADGPLFYTDTGGTNVSGVGTVNDFTLFTPGNVTITGPGLAARNLTLQSQGTIDFTGFTGIPNSAINGGNAGGSLNFIAGSFGVGGDILFNALGGGTIGTAAQPFNHTLTFIATNNITIQGGIYMSAGTNFTVAANMPVSMNNNTVTPPASGTGDVVLAGNYDVNTLGDANFSGRNFTICGIGGAGACAVAGANQSTIGENLVAGGNVILGFTNDVNVTAGTATAVSASGALVNGGSVNIGSGAAPVHAIVLTGGTSVVTGATPQVLKSDAQITASGNLGAYVGAGGLSMTGGSASVLAGASLTGQATAVAQLKGGSVSLNVSGNVIMQGGTSVAQTGLSASKFDLSADAGASIVSGSSFSPTIAGSLTMTGGNATAGPASAHAAASVIIDGGTNLLMNIGTGLTLTGGTAVANGGVGDCSAGGGACANVSALLSSQAGKDITIATGDLNFTGGSATANGGSATSAAFAGTDSGTASGTLATLVTITATAGHLTLAGGPQSGTGRNNSDSAILSVGGIKLYGLPSRALTLNGQSGSGLFQNILNSGTIIRLDGSIPPVSVFGGTSICPAGGLACSSGTYGNAFVLSGAPPSNLDPLQAGLLAAIDQSKPNRIAGFLDDSNLGSRRSADKNYCK